MLIDVNFMAFKWIDNERINHKPMQVKFKVKAENIGSVVLDDPNKEEKEKKKLVIPALPSLENLFSQEEIFYET